MDSDCECEECEETEMKKVGNVKQLLINQYIKSLVNLEKLKLKDSDMEEKCVCDMCIKYLKEIVIKYNGSEKIDRYMECSNDCIGDINVEKED